MASWDFLRLTPRGDSNDFARFLVHTRVLCEALTREFTASIWPIVW